MTNRGTSKYCA